MREQFTPGLEMPRRHMVAQGLAYSALTLGVIFAGNMQHDEPVAEMLPKHEVNDVAEYDESKTDTSTEHEVEALNALRIVQEESISRQHEREDVPDCWMPTLDELSNTSKENLPNIELACTVALEQDWASDPKRQWKCFVVALDAEAGFDEKAINENDPTTDSDDAGGIPQALPPSKMGKGWYGDAEQQLRWVAETYIKDRYGDEPCIARQHQIDYGWY